MGTIVRGRKYHGMADHGLSRYLALYTAQLGWVLLGVYFLSQAYWPSTCTPRTVIEIFVCSPRLPESRHFIETALFTWLWSTPILILLDLSRRYRAWLEKRAR
jgi:hypothetical protein